MAMQSALHPIHAVASRLFSREGTETCCDENVGPLRNAEKNCALHIDLKRDGACHAFSKVFE